MKFNKKIFLISSSLVVSSAMVAGIGTYVLVASNKNNEDVNLIKSLKFEVNPEANEEFSENEKKSDYNNGIITTTKPKKFDISNHFASEYTYSSFYVSSSDNEPTLVSDNSFWNNIKNKYSYNANKYFTLLNIDKDLSLVDFENKYNFYYHSYANDFEGKLYLRVYLEDKEDKLVKEGKTLTERKVNWKFVDFIMEGFKKYSGENDELLQKTDDYNNNQHQFSISTYTRNQFLKGDLNIDGGWNSISDLLDLNNNKNELLPTRKLDSNDAIKKAYLSISRILSFYKSNNIFGKTKSKYIIDDSKPIYFEQDSSNSNLLTMNYYIKKFVPNAKYSDSEELTTSKEIKINQMQKLTFNTLYFELKKFAEKIKISVNSNTPINETIPSINSPLFISSQANTTGYTNTKNGYYKEFNLFLDSTEEEINNFNNLYELKYYKRSSIDIFSELDFSKSTSNTFDKTPLLEIKQNEGKAKYAYSINKKGSNVNFLGVFEVSGFKEKQ
ncbi:Uncharacterised protein [Mycoplasmopsis maculosa]|uniref:Lipoprotein n=1 Tax=Mycoplasmopsis maculosa TaxID=114885 RepID=A0A449B4C7_9BACT|nr:hypothetical protein [Mycoplasmopsis maculosa]VEU75463.1 Uncharacterised protein [Mycoplasmopsis maculosa]